MTNEPLANVTSGYKEPIPAFSTLAIVLYVDSANPKTPVHITVPAWERLNPYKGELPKYTSLGSYPIFYLCADNGVLCPKCANEDGLIAPDAPKDWRIVAADVNYEDESLYCDGCDERIESAYGEDQA